MGRQPAGPSREQCATCPALSAQPRCTTSAPGYRPTGASSHPRPLPRRAASWVLLREAPMARNLQALLPLVEEFGTSRIAFGTDDKDPDDIAENGHINSMIRDAVAAGIAPGDALVLGSLNPALWHGLEH